MTLFIVADIRVFHGHLPFVKQSLERIVGPTLAEPGCIQFDLHQEVDAPRHFLIFEQWASRADWEAHMKSRHILNHLEATNSMMSVILYDLIRSGTWEHLPRHMVVTEYRCDVTKNPCGTDTWMEGETCKCSGCQEWLIRNGYCADCGVRWGEQHHDRCQKLPCPSPRDRPDAPVYWDDKRRLWAYQDTKWPVVRKPKAIQLPGVPESRMTEVSAEAMASLVEGDCDFFKHGTDERPAECKRCKLSDEVVDAQASFIEALKYPPGELGDKIREWDYWGSLGDEQAKKHSRRGIKMRLREAVTALRRMVNFHSPPTGETPPWELQTHVPRYCSSCGLRLVCKCGADKEGD